MAFRYSLGTNYHEDTSGTPTSGNFTTIAIRLRITEDNPSVSRFFFYWGDDSSSTVWITGEFTTAGLIKIWHRGTGGLTVITTTDYADSAWHNVVLTIDLTYNSNAGTETVLYVDDASGILGHTSTNQPDIANYNAVAIGAIRDFTPGADFGGDACDLTFWNVLLDVDEIAAYNAGVSPLLIRPQSLVSYRPLVRDTRDLISGNSMTAGGTPTIAAHPRIYMPSAPFIITAPAVVGGGLSIPVAMHHYNQMRA